MYQQPVNEEDRLDEDDLREKIPSKYQELYDSDDFEKFKSKKEWWD